jgi:major membrane immunogen (membrane-anchored lipoprotein)
MKDMKMIEDMVAKMLMMGKGGMGKNKMEEGEYEEEDYSEDEGYEQDKVTIKFCGKDALKKAHDLLMGSAYKPKK